MSYSINISSLLGGEALSEGDVKLNTYEFLKNNDDYISQSTAFLVFVDSMPPQSGNNGSYLEKFKNHDKFSSFTEALEEKYIPAYSYVHILQDNPTETKIALTTQLIKDVGIITLTNLDTSAISLIKCGYDMSDSIELAYYINDGVSPIRAEKYFTLNHKAQELCDYCRTIVAKDGEVNVDEIIIKAQEIEAKTTVTMEAQFEIVNGTLYFFNATTQEKIISLDLDEIRTMLGGEILAEKLRDETNILFDHIEKMGMNIDAEKVLDAVEKYSKEFNNQIKM